MTNQKFVYGISKEVLTVSQMDTLLISFTLIYSIFQWFNCQKIILLFTKYC